MNKALVPLPENCTKNAKIVQKIAQTYEKNCAKIAGRVWLIHTNLVLTLSKNKQIQ